MHLTRPLALLLVPLLAGAPRLAAQTATAAVPSGYTPAAAQASSIAGRVLSASTEQPIADAVVVLEAARDAALVGTSRAMLGRSITRLTDERGAYRFDGVSPGSYRLMVRHLGFRPAVVEVELARGTPFRVSVGMEVSPIRLEAMDVHAVTDPYGRTRSLSDEVHRGRLDAEQWREGHLMPGDAAVLTHTDVVEAVTLAETDLFRALHRLPGVTTRDDWTAAFWTRGAPWSQTRVYVDGLPLFNPVHAMGVLAGVNPDAIGAATFQPGGRSAAIGEGAAGVLDLTTRGATGPGTHGLAELSVVSARALGEWASANGRTGAVLSVRRSFVDLATRLAEMFGAKSGTYLPYAFHDVSARADADLGRGWGLEASGLESGDRVHGSLSYLLRDTRGTWGNLLGRVSVLVPGQHVRARLTIGASRFDARLSPTPPSVTTDTAPSHGPTRNRVSVALAGLELSKADAAPGPQWAGGAQLTLQRLAFVGPSPRPYPIVLPPETLSLRGRRLSLALWSEWRWAVRRDAVVEAGVRAEFGQLSSDVPAIAWAPRVSARVRPGGGRVTLSAALARSWQYTQALAPAGPSVGPDLYLTDVWLLAGSVVPAVRADIATLGGEVWLGDGWIASVQGYVRRTTGVAVPDPAPGPLDAQRPLFAVGTNQAHGLELSLRRIVGRWTTSASYSFSISDLDARSPTDLRRYRYPASADRRHAVDFTAMARLGTGLRLGVAATVMSGAPFSRLFADPTCGPAPALCAPADTSSPLIERPNAERTPAYASLDLVADWSRAWRHLSIGAFLQVRNALGNANAVTYEGSEELCSAGRPPELLPAGSGVCDRFRRGLGRLPLVGLRIEF